MMMDFEKKLDEIFSKKFPKLPEKLKEVIVKYGPYVSVILLILWIPIILALIGIAITATPFALLGGDKGLGYVISVVFGLVMMALQIKAIPGLFKRQIKSWRLLFYISLISALSNLIQFNAWNLIVGTIISWYFLFQIKSYYK